MSVYVNILAQTDHPGQATAATDETFEVGEAQFDATVTEVSCIPNTTQAGVDTTTRTMTLQNKGQAGAGTTVIATFVTDVAGGGLTANDEKLWTLTATVADRNISAGDVLAVVETHGSTGAAHPAMTVTVKGTRR
jgi:hypothetical protein